MSTSRGLQRQSLFLDPAVQRDTSKKLRKRLQCGLRSSIVVALLFFVFSLLEPRQTQNLFSLSLLSPNFQNSVTIKGPLDGDAVLCTREATFDLKTVETTNSLLLVPEGEVREFISFLL